MVSTAMSDQRHEMLIEKLTRESVRLQKWQIALDALSAVLGALALFGVYLTQSPLVLLITAVAVALALMLVAIASFPESDESLWMRKVTAANNLRRIYLVYKEDSSSATPSMGNVYRSALETAYGQAIVSGRQNAADYFKRLIDEYDSSLSRT
jgi:hypothetical protein